MSASSAQRIRIQQWTLWEVPPDGLRRMMGELDQELSKLRRQITAAERQFDQLIAAGDPITLDETRADIRSLWVKVDRLTARRREIDGILRQKSLDERTLALGRRFGISNLLWLLRIMRIIVLATSLVAIGLSLLPTMPPATIAVLDNIDLACSLILLSEFGFRLLLVTGRGAYFRARAFDIFLSLPLVKMAELVPDVAFIARLVTLLRAGRLLRLIIGERRDLLQSIPFLTAPEFVLLRRATFSGLLVVGIGAALIRVLESANDPAFASYDENLWWGLKIALTGNVDTSPQTLLGRLVTIGIIVIGISLSGILIAAITSVLVSLSSEESDSERQQDDMAETLATMRSQLDLLTDARQQAVRAAMHINSMLSNVQQEDRTALLNEVASELVSAFGCQEAAIYTLDEGKKQAIRVAAAGNESYIPDARIFFDLGIVGRCAQIARRGGYNNGEQNFEIEPMPLADGVAIAAPLYVRRALRGSLRVMALGVLHVTAPQSWLRDELIKTLLQDVGIALSQYLYSLESASRHDSLLASISDLEKTMERITTTLDYQRLLFVICEGAAALLDADMAKLMLLEPDGTFLRGVAWYGMDDELGTSLLTRLGDGLSGLCAKTGNPVKTSNLLTDQRVTIESSQALRSGMRSELCVPVRIRGAVLGVLSVMMRIHKRFSQEEEALLGALAGQAGAAIENARVYGLVQRQLQIAETMRAISARLTEADDERTLLRWILEQIQHNIRHDTASIFLVEGDVLRLAAAVGFSEGVLPPDLAFPLAGHPLMGRVTVTGDPIRIDDTRTDPMWQAGPTEVLSWIGVPMLNDGVPIGVLGIDSQQVAAFTPDDVTVAERFAVQAALAVRIGRLYRAAHPVHQ